MVNAKDLKFENSKLTENYILEKLNYKGRYFETVTKVKSVLKQYAELLPKDHTPVDGKNDIDVICNLGNLSITTISYSVKQAACGP